MSRKLSGALAVLVSLFVSGCDRSLSAAPPAAPAPSAAERKASTPAAAPVAAPKDTLHTPAKDSAERKAVLDALRPSVEKDLEQKVVFMIDHLAVKDGFAFLTGRPVQPDGKAIDYRNDPLPRGPRGGRLRRQRERPLPRGGRRLDGGHLRVRLDRRPLGVLAGEVPRAEGDLPGRRRVSRRQRRGTIAHCGAVL